MDSSNIRQSETAAARHSVTSATVDSSPTFDKPTQCKRTQTIGKHQLIRITIMSFIRASSRLSGSLRRSVPVTTRASTSLFHTSVARQGLKEDNHGTEDSEALSEHYEAEKQGQIKNHKEGKGKWNQNLASNSEASVKADRGEVDSKESFVDLQDRTKNEPNKKA
ncbi:hypothetical protein BDV19DRAFT_384139 [Aspergillus venezuelensis]